MNCPVCKRDLAPTLSICFTCGAMVNDSVREELETKIAPVSGSLRASSGPLIDKPVTPVAISDIPAKPRETPVVTEAPKPLQMRFETADLPIKKTSPTLVDFQIKNPKVPDWRLQLQNSVRQRSAGERTEAVNIRVPKRQTTNGANALKVEPAEEAVDERHVNPRVAKALRRIEDSRNTFLKTEEPSSSARPVTAPKRPFNVVAKSDDLTTPKLESKPNLNPSPRPILVSAFKFEKKQGFDTNKLPPLTPATDEIVEPQLEVSDLVADEVAPIEKISLPVQPESVTDEAPDAHVEPDEIEDLAPLSLRFNAGLFDLIAGGFITGIVMAPFVASGGNWLSFTGVLALSAAASVVMFLYLSISLAFIGRTLGMKLFSLEMVDVEENAYPTLHQAAVNSAAFIMSIACGGLGFLPVFFNEERRGVPDLLAGTIMVREY